DISMYPKMLEKGGIPQKELITSLIELAVDEFADEETSASFAGKLAFKSVTDSDTISFEVPCSYAFDGDNAVLAFSEPDGAQNRITLNGNTLTVSRSGDAKSLAEFHLNTQEEVPYKYETPYGEMDLSANTYSVVFDATPFGASLELIYDIMQNGEKINRAQIQIEVMKA
ncbi:MAG: DUF1934 family protein, partial [Clostridia bacterium]|nr:DUF1934 family protein [Clostridia bacterium]